MVKILILTLVFLIVKETSEFDPSQHRNWNLLRHDICGLVDADRIIGGEEAAMNAYPWLARVGYKNKYTGKISFRCGGAIVSSDAILTAAHCVYDLSKGFHVGVIRLGEHNIDTNPDCENGFCADPVLDIQPREIIIPKNYNNPPFQHDIAIIRLEEQIKFSASVKPICFPSDQLFIKDFVGSVAEVAGWGVYDIDDPRSSIKLQVVKLPIIENEECQKYLPGINMTSSQLCVGGIIGKDSCSGDSGGPLMKVDNGDAGPRYFLLGIVSFGPTKCGKSKMGGVYTKITSYMHWVLDNLA